MKSVTKTARPVRPVYLSLFAFAFPVTAIASILHRITGVLLALGLVPLFIVWHTSLQSPQGFALVSAWLNQMWCQLGLWLYASCLFYHALAGIKHLAMDLGWGETQSASSALSWTLMLLALLFSGGLFYLLLLV